MTRLANIFAYASPSLIKCGARRTEFHRASIVAVGTAHGVHYLITPIAPFRSIEFVSALLAHQARNVRTFTSPASARLNVFLPVYAGATCAQNLKQIFYAMAVSARRVVFFGKGIAIPKNDHLRVLLEHVLLLRTVVFTLESCISSHCPRLIFSRKVFGKFFVLRYNRVGHLYAAIIEDTRHFCPAF